MGKKRIHWSEKTYHRFLREGRGTGEGANYLPWVQIHDFPSNGISSRPPGIKTGRVHPNALQGSDDPLLGYSLRCRILLQPSRRNFHGHLQASYPHKSYFCKSGSKTGSDRTKEEFL